MKCIRVSLAKTKEDGKFEVSALTNVETDDLIETNDWEILLQTLKTCILARRVRLQYRKGYPTK